MVHKFKDTKLSSVALKSDKVRKQDTKRVTARRYTQDDDLYL